MDIILIYLLDWNWIIDMYLTIFDFLLLNIVCNTDFVI